MHHAQQGVLSAASMEGTSELTSRHLDRHGADDDDGLREELDDGDDDRGEEPDDGDDDLGEEPAPTALAQALLAVLYS